MKFFKSLLALAVLAGTTVGASAAGEAFNVLVYSKTNAFRHSDAINVGRPFFQKQGELLGFGVKLSEDPTDFSAENLKKYQVVVLLNSTGEFLNDKKAGKDAHEARKSAFEAWVKDGGGVVGLHSATDAYTNWPTFWKIIGGSFKHHPHHQTCTLEALDTAAPTAKFLNGKTEWVVFDEWYVFRNLQRDSHVIFQVKAGTLKGRSKSKNSDELVSYFEGGEKSPTHPFVWSRSYGKGKIFYTSRGHYGRAFAEADYAQQVIAGVFSVIGKTAPQIDPATLPKIEPRKGKKK
jgi:type 1 glutamine amidotransferase